MSSFTIRKVQAGGSKFFKPAEFDNHLILITSVNDIREIDDKFKGPNTPAAFIDFVDLDSPSNEVHHDVQVTHGGIINRLEKGWDNVLGRIKKVQTKKGYQAWVLTSPAVEDETKAIAWAKTQEGSDATAAPWDAVE